MKLLKKKKWNAPKKGFYGWYFKCQSEEDTVIFIASANRGEDESTGRLQIATKDGVWDVDFPIECFSEKKGNIFLAQNRFGRSGIRFNITTADLRGKGNLIFSDFTPLDYDIMGPFVLVPFMEWRHANTNSTMLSVTGKGTEEHHSRRNICGLRLHLTRAP